jgi:AcrR family transcriptional regulator
MPKHGHEDLRRVVLDASLALVTEDGVAALSMREVARRAGVTHGAPYHHFADRGAILAALAVEGFEVLTTCMSEAVARAGTQPRAQLEASGRAYFAFAVEHPAYFRVMFRPELFDPGEHPEVDAASARAFAVLVGIVSTGQRVGGLAQGDVLSLVLTAWSTAHGLAALWVDGPLSRGAQGLTPDPVELGLRVSQTLGGLFDRS